MLGLLGGLVVGALGENLRQETHRTACLRSQMVRYFMTKAVRIAGFSGCRRSVEGPPPFFGSDAQTLSLWHASQNNAILLSQENPQILSLNREMTVRPRERVIVSNCLSAEIREVVSVSVTKGMQKILLSHPLTFHFPAGSEVYRFERERFFVKNKRLFLQLNPGEKIELARGIRGFHVHFDKSQGRVQGVMLQLEWETACSSSIEQIYAAPRNVVP